MCNRIPVPFGTYCGECHLVVAPFAPHVRYMGKIYHEEPCFGAFWRKKATKQGATTRLNKAIIVLMLLVPITAQAQVEPKFQFGGHVHNTLHYLFNNLEVEFAFCAYGKKKDNVVTITRVFIPKINTATQGTVWYDEKSCPTKDLLGYGHSHPSGICQLSRTDLYSLMHTAPPFHFLVCQDDFRAFIKADVRNELIKAGKLAEVLKPPWTIQ